MIDRATIERAAERFRAPEDSLDRLLRRRERKRRNQRLVAGIVGIAVFLAAVLFLTSGGALERGQTPAVTGSAQPGPRETGSTATGPTGTGASETGPTYNGTTDDGTGYAWGPVTDADIALGDIFARAWMKGDGEAAAATFSPEGTFDGFSPAILPALHDWFRAGGWEFEDLGGACGVHGWSDRWGVVGCSFEYENDLTRALGLRPQGMTISFVTEAGGIKTAWFGAGGDFVYNMFGWPNEDRGRDDLFGDVWDMFIDWLSSRYPDDFVRMYDLDRGYPILDPDSIGLWERYTDEFVALPHGSFTRWLANQSFEVQARRICVTKTDQFWATVDADDLRGHERSTTLAEIAEETLAQLRALPLGTEADRATMEAFVQLAESWIDGTRRNELGFYRDRALRNSMSQLIDGCLITGFLG